MREVPWRVLKKEEPKNETLAEDNVTEKEENDDEDDDEIDGIKVKKVDIE